jgi:SprT protein
LPLSYQQQINQRVEQCFAHASEYFQRSFEFPNIHFNQRGKIAGCARLQKNELRFNPVLLNDNLPLFLDEVVPHEVCHLLTYSLYGRVRPHGKEWQALMIELFGLSPHTYHKMDVTKVAGKHFDYQCQCGPITLSIRRHNKVLRGQQQYICRKCRSTLSPC